MNSSTDRIVVGRVGKPHGLGGESTVVSDSDDPGRFIVGAVFLTDRGVELTVAQVRPYRDRGLIVRFEGIDSRAAAEALRGSLLTVPSSERRDLDEGEYWPEDLVGLDAVDPQGVRLGEVVRVEFGPGQDRLVVSTADGEVLVPFVAEIVGDPDGGSIVIDGPAGLFP